MTAPSGKAVCAICGKSADRAYAPFCSRRCADVDLQRWLSGRYVVPGEAREDADDPPAHLDDEA